MRSPSRLGRAFTAADDRPDAPPVIILSDGLWHGRFGGDPAVVGRIVEVDGDRTEIVGVMPPAFAFPESETSVWRPIGLDESDARLGAFCCMGIARLADGASLDTVEAEIGTMTASLVELFPGDAVAEILSNAGLRPLIEPAREFLVGDIRATLWILLGAVAFLLLIACANVANLFLVRSEARRREISIRYALGESRGRLRASLLGESVVLGLAGGVLALPLTQLGVRLIVRYGPEDLPRLHEISVDGSVLAFGFTLSLLAGLLFGLAPALRAGAVAAAASLTDGGRGASMGRERHVLRRSLVVVQVALALTLLVGSGLALRSFQRLARVDPGFDPTDVLTFHVALPEREYESFASRLAFHRELVERIGAMPGVRAAAAVSSTPMSGSIGGSGHSIEDRPRAEGEVPPLFMMKRISPGYFDTMRISILEGRDFEALDNEREVPVVIVTDVVARTYWPNESALGKGIRGGAGASEDEWYRVVGVVDDVHEIDLHEDPPELVYYPLFMTEDVPLSMAYVVRAAAAETLVTGAREAVRGLDPNLPVSDIATMETIVRESRSERAFVMVLLIAAATAALLLGAIGLYGVISYMVAQRRKEIAIRMAIGAHMSNIRRLVLGEAVWLAFAGCLLGLGLAFAMTRRLQALLFETSPLDPAVLGSVSVALVAVCLLASWLPARRAACTEPMTALRLE